MNLISDITGALGRLYIRCSGIGLLDDARTQRFKASIFVATWLTAAFYSAGSVFNYWIYDLKELVPVVLPHRYENQRTVSVFALLAVAAVSLVIAVKIGKKFALYAKTSASGLETWWLGGWYVAVILSIVGTSNRYGSLLVLSIHTAFFLWLVREHRRRDINNVTM